MRKVGDIVKIRSIDWYQTKRNEDGDISLGLGWCFGYNMVKYCSEEAIITDVINEKFNAYHLNISGVSVWQDWMFEPIRLKLGDKVKIKSKEWYDRYKDINGSIKCYNETFVKHMADFCGNEYTINNSHFENGNAKYRIEGWAFTEDMFESYTKLENDKNLSSIPKFKIGDKVKIIKLANNTKSVNIMPELCKKTYEIVDVLGNFRYKLASDKMLPFNFTEDMLENVEEKDLDVPKEYAVGDIVKIKSFKWYSEHKNAVDGAIKVGGRNFTEEMRPFCDEVVTIVAKYLDYNTVVYKVKLRFNTLEYLFTAEMFDGIINDTTGSKTLSAKEQELLTFIVGKKVKVFNSSDGFKLNEILKRLGYTDLYDKTFVYCAFYSARKVYYGVTTDTYLDHPLPEITLKEIFNKAADLNLMDACFRTFDRVLVKDRINDLWKIDLFSLIDEGESTFRYICQTGRYKRCIPFCGNESKLHEIGL